MYNSITLPKRTNQSFLSIVFILIVLFVLNPFLGLVVYFISLGRRQYSSLNECKLLLFFPALFLGLLAFTQDTSQGDIIRVYESIINAANGDSGVIDVINFESPLFKYVSVFLYFVVGDIRIISLFWVTTLYYLFFLSIININTYLGRAFNFRLTPYILLAVLCFVPFTQVTEIMKQAVATSLFFWGWTCFLSNKKNATFIAIILSIGIHASAFFYLPLLFVKYFKKNTLFIFVLISFAFRQFNLMESLEIFQGLPILSSIGDMAGRYNESNMENFFRSDSLYFVLLFWGFFMFTMLLSLMEKGKDNVVLSACYLLIIVLNLNYTVSHNYTRLLTMLFPYLFLLYMGFENTKGTNKKIFSIGIVVFSTISIYMLAIGRLTKGSGYYTSYMDNSLIKIVSSTIFGYLS